MERQLTELEQDLGITEDLMYPGPAPAPIGQALPAPDDAPQMPDHRHCWDCMRTIVDSDDHAT